VTLLTGRQIRLSPTGEDDLAQTRSWANDKGLAADILRVLPVSETDQRRWLADINQDPAKQVFTIKTVDDDTHIGNCGLYHVDWIHRRAEFWILIGNREYHGRGIGTETTALILKYAFQSLNLQRVYLHVAENNAPAVALYSKTGFVKEGVLRNHYFINGQYLDVLVMSILAEDYVRSLKDGE